MNASGGTACTECGLGQILDESFRAEKEAEVVSENDGSMGGLYIHLHESRLQICPPTNIFGNSPPEMIHRIRPKYLSETRVWRL